MAIVNAAVAIAVASASAPVWLSSKRAPFTSVFACAAALLSIGLDIRLSGDRQR